jgi:hypothetical protein
MEYLGPRKAATTKQTSNEHESRHSHESHSQHRPQIPQQQVPVQQTPVQTYQPYLQQSQQMTVQPTQAPVQPTQASQQTYFHPMQQTPTQAPQRTYQRPPMQTAAAAVSIPPSEPVTKSDKMTLVCAAVLALLWSACTSDLWLSVRFLTIGGIALSACLLAFFIAVIILRRPNLKQKSIWSLVFLACALGLILVPALTTSHWSRTLNALALVVVIPMTYLSLWGASDDTLLSPGGVSQAFKVFLGSQFEHWTELKNILSTWTRGRRDIIGIALGTACALALLLIVVPALASADENFAHLVHEALKSITPSFIRTLLIDLIRFLLVTPMAFSLLFELRHPHWSTTAQNTMPNGSNPNGAAVFTQVPAESTHAPVAPLATVLVVLNVVYLAFVGIQTSYIFQGIDALKRVGGYANYAREGFFDLVIVAAIDLLVVLVCMYLRRDQPRSAFLTTLELILVVLTVMLLASAAWRMGLYVQKYGLTRLRLLTCWGMVAIAFLLLATVVKLLRPRIRIFRVSLIGMMLLSLAFGLMQSDAIIARVNVDGYLNGSIEQVDPFYLLNLGQDGKQPLIRLTNEAHDKSMRDTAKNQLETLDKYIEYENSWSTFGL